MQAAPRACQDPLGQVSLLDKHQRQCHQTVLGMLTSHVAVPVASWSLKVQTSPKFPHFNSKSANAYNSSKMHSQLTGRAASQLGSKVTPSSLGGVYEHLPGGGYSPFAPVTLHVCKAALCQHRRNAGENATPPDLPLEKSPVRLNHPTRCVGEAYPPWSGRLM